MNGAKRKRPIRTFLISLLVIVAYFALFPYPLGRELVASPAWVRDLSSAGIPSEPGGVSGGDAGSAPAPFRLNGWFGYVSPAGEILYLDRPAFGVTLSTAGFITYSRVGTTFIFQNPRGRKEFSFSGAGYPLLSADGLRLFTVKSDTTGIRELDKAGDTLWGRDFESPVTSLSIQPDAVCAGLLDGTLELLDSKGAPLMSFAPKGSRISVILGCTVSADGSRVAAVSGIDPQTLVVLERKDGKYAPVFQAALGTQFRREVRVGFSPDGRFLVLEGNGSARFLDTAARQLGTIELSGGLSSMAFLPRQKVITLLSGDPAAREIVASRGPGAVYSRERFQGAAVYLGSVGGEMLLGIDTKLLKINLEEM